jgi:hypothetical protein
LFERVRKLDLAAIFQLWYDAGPVHHDFSKQGTLSILLAEALQKQSPSPGYLQTIRAFVLDEKNTKLDRAQLLSVLGQAATRPCAEALLSAAPQINDRDLNPASASAIASLATFRDRTYHADLAEPLQKAWVTTDRSDLLFAIGRAIVGVGTSSGIETLLKDALSTDRSMRQQAAEAALLNGTTINPAVVAPLKEELIRAPLGSPASKLAGAVLVKSGASGAGAALVEWFRTASDAAAPVALEYSSHAGTTAVHDAWAAALDPAVSFNSEKNREAIRAGLAAYAKARQ